MGLLPSCCPSRRCGGSHGHSVARPGGGNVSVPGPAPVARLGGPVVRTQPLGKRSVVWMWEKSKKCFLLLPLPAWLLSTTPS